MRCGTSSISHGGIARGQTQADVQTSWHTVRAALCDLLASEGVHITPQHICTLAALCPLLLSLGTAERPLASFAERESQELAAEQQPQAASGPPGEGSAVRDGGSGEVCAGEVPTVSWREVAQCCGEPLETLVGSLASAAARQPRAADGACAQPSQAPHSMPKRSASEAAAAAGTAMSAAAAEAHVMPAASAEGAAAEEQRDAQDAGADFAIRVLDPPRHVEPAPQPAPEGAKDSGKSGGAQASKAIAKRRKRKDAAAESKADCASEGAAADAPIDVHAVGQSAAEASKPRNRSGGSRDAQDAQHHAENERPPTSDANAPEAASSRGRASSKAKDAPLRAADVMSDAKRSLRSASRSRNSADESVAAAVADAKCGVADGVAAAPAVGSKAAQRAGLLAEQSVAGAPGSSDAHADAGDDVQAGKLPVGTRGVRKRAAAYQRCLAQAVGLLHASWVEARARFGGQAGADCGQPGQSDGGGGGAETQQHLDCFRRAALQAAVQRVSPVAEPPAGEAALAAIAAAAAIQRSERDGSVAEAVEHPGLLFLPSKEDSGATGAEGASRSTGRQGAALTAGPSGVLDAARVATLVEAAPSLSILQSVAAQPALAAANVTGHGAACLPDIAPAATFAVACQTQTEGCVRSGADGNTAAAEPAIRAAPSDGRVKSAGKRTSKRESKRAARIAAGAGNELSTSAVDALHRGQWHAEFPLEDLTVKDIVCAAKVLSEHWLLDQTGAIPDL